MEDEYENLSREELIDQIRKLKCHVKQLRNVIAHKDNPQHGGKKERECRPFNFSGQSKRHVAFKVTYVGWDYQGLVVQEDCNNTIEDHLFRALTLTKLVEDRATSNYHRCGRTDKGVSAFSQVISLDVRSNGKDKTELEYCKMLNRVLPQEIRVWAWAPVPDNFSARFDCIRRTYKYFLPKANLDINKMLEGGKLLEGTHDFRNYCKSDGKKTTIRRIFSVNVEPLNTDLLRLTVVGQSFLWHQIRCIVSLLILIGVGKEPPELITKLLDANSFNSPKPNYGMALEYPLVLFDVEYENVEWVTDKDNLKYVCRELKRLWTKEAIKSSMLKEMINAVGDLDEGIAEDMIMGTKTRTYKSLLSK